MKDITAGRLPKADDARDVKDIRLAKPAGGQKMSAHDIRAALP
jgi:hypothetical protein